MENSPQEIKEDLKNMFTIMQELVRDKDNELLNDDVTRTIDTRERFRRTKRRRDDSSSGPRLKDTRPRGGEESYDGDDERSNEIHDNESSTRNETLEVETMSRRPRRGWRFRPRSQ